MIVTVASLGHMPIHVRVLGPVALSGADGLPVHVGGPRAAAVLTALAFAGPAGARTDRIIEAVWGDREPASATRTIQTYLARLRGAAPGLIEARRNGYAISPEATVDCQQAREHLAAARDLQAHDPLAAQRELRAGAQLWRGEVAEGASLAGAADMVRELEELRLDTLSALIDVAARNGSGDVLVEAARELLRLDPFREEAAAALARHLAALGRQADALAVLRECRDALIDQLGVEPSALLRDTEVAVLRQEIAPAGSLRGDRLPTSLSSFVGRDDDLRTLADALAASRLVTVVATGGAGKSRLALEVARQWRDAGRSVLHVGLAGFAAGGTVEALRRVAAAGPGSDWVDEVAAALPGPCPLLVLDNAEELLDEVVEVVQSLTARHHDLRVLVTSRSALACPGERVHRLGPLSMIGADGGEAARLLVERAENVRPGVTAGRLEAMIQISRELDGLPLALELAAARLRDVSVLQLRDELAAQLGRARLRGGPARQRSLDAVMASSIDALDDQARQTHLRLATLRSWWTDDIAVDLLADIVSAPDAPVVVDSLVDASLLVADLDGPVRWLRAYEPVRQDALRRLRDSGQEPIARERHLEACLLLMRRAEPHLRGPDEARWLEAVDRSRGDLEAALEHARSQGNSAAVVELAVRSSRMWRMRWSTAFALPWLGAALDGAVNPADGAVLSSDLAYLLTRLGRYEEAERVADQAVALARQCGQPQLLAQTHHMRGLVDKDRLRFAAARPWFVQAAAYRHEAGDLAGEAMSLGSMADMEAARGEFDEAERAYAEGLRLMREAGSPSGQLAYLHSLAELEVGRQDVDAAAGFLAEAAPLAATTGDQIHAGLLQLVAAWLDRVRCQPSEVCIASSLEALRLAAAADLRSALDAVEHCGGILVELGRPEEARPLFIAAAHHRERLGAPLSATRSRLVERDRQRAATGPMPAAADDASDLMRDLTGLVEAARAALLEAAGG
jgi:predicted ATPase/DNA-binding SARP family transcriptional activator